MVRRQGRVAGVAALALAAVLVACGRSGGGAGGASGSGDASGSGSASGGGDVGSAPGPQVSTPTLPSAGAVARRAEGRFSTLTYNVAGLPQGISSAPSEREPATRAISCYVKAFDVVNVQEDFNYHAALYDACDDHPYRSSTSGGMGLGSGLNTLSRFPILDWERVRWRACNGVDCLTPKGFTVARVRLAEGVQVDVYDLHAQAQDGAADLEARRANVRQLASFIEWYSAGRAVIVMGDTNTRYTRDGDGLWALLRRGMGDAWVDLVRGGAIPASGSATLSCDPATTGPGCEIVDKVLYRDNGFVGLRPLTYAIRTDAQDEAGRELSDHRPVEVTWSWATPVDLRLGDAVGGPHGDPFDDVSLLPAQPVVRSVSLRAGRRLDRVELALSSGAVLSHGGAGGDPAALALADGEVVTALEVCTGKHDGWTQVFMAGFTTSAGRTLAGGTRTAECSTFAAAAGWQIVGFHGRAADTVTRLGVVYAPAPPPGGAAPGARWFELVNRASGLCLDVTGASLAAGTPVEQWTCLGVPWQRWSWDPRSGLVRSEADPRLCLDVAGDLEDARASAIVWPCVGNANQRFDLDGATGVLSLRASPARVVDGSGVTAGSPVITWTDRGGANQRWDVVASP